MKTKTDKRDGREASESLPQLCITYNLYLPEGLVIEIEGYGDKSLVCLLDAMQRACEEYPDWRGIEQKQCNLGWPEKDL